MDGHSSQAPTLDDLMTVNEELAALVAAGVPLDLEIAGHGTDLPTTCAKYSATLGRRIGQGQSLESALGERGEGIPRTYRALMLLGLRFDRMNLALDSSRELAVASDDSRFIIRAGFVYPLIVACLAYVGMACFLWWVVPLLASTYDVPGMTPGHWITLFNSVRTSLPYWVAIPPAMLALVVFGLVWRSGRRRRGQGRLSDPLQMTSRLRYANFAEICGDLLQTGVAKPEAIDLAASACGDLERVDRLDSNASAQAVELTPDERAAMIAAFPPLLSYVLTAIPTDADCSLALRAAASVYRQSSAARKDRFQRLLPMLLIVFVGGGVVLLYGLMLFAPLAEMLDALSM